MTVSPVLTNSAKELLEWSHQWTEEDSRTAVEAREHLLRTARLQNVALLSDMLYSAKRERTQLVEKYANPYKRVLSLESTVHTTYDIRKVLRLAKNGGDSNLACRKRYEALMLFDQACLLSEIDTSNSYYALSEDFEEFLELLAARFFKAGTDRTVDVEIAFDALRECRVIGIAIADPNDPAFAAEGIPRSLKDRHLMTRTEAQLPCRVMPDGPIAYFDARLKNQYETYLKILWRQSVGKPEPFNVTDRSGIRMVVPTERDAWAVTESMRTFVKAQGGETSEPTDNFQTAQRGDGDNLDSSTEFKAIKMEIKWKWRVHELQVMTFQDYFMSEYVLTETNHDLYKLKRCINLHFPLLFPTQVYGIDWTDKRVRSLLFEEKRRQLRARIDSH